MPERLGQYFKLDNSTEFVCEWCGCAEFHLRGKLMVNLCDGCETLVIENQKFCDQVNDEIMIEASKNVKTSKNIVYLESSKTLSVNLSPDKLPNDTDDKPATYSQYQKAQEIKTKLINPIKLKYAKK